MVECQELSDLQFGWLYKNVFKEIHDRQLSGILDIGCGTGEHVIKFAGLFPDANIVGIDKYGDYKKSTERKAIAERAVAESGLSRRCKIIEADAHDLPFQEGAFDLIHGNRSQGVNMDYGPNNDGNG